MAGSVKQVASYQDVPKECQAGGYSVQIVWQIEASLSASFNVSQ